MKITKIETFHVKPQWIFLKVTTDSGLVGWGEPDADGRRRMVAQAVEDLQASLVGQDPEQVEHLWQIMHRGASHRGGSILFSALSGIEQALWDIKGKAHELPVYQMLGGACRTRIRMVLRCGGGPTPRDAAFQAKGARVKGYTAMKTMVSESLVRPLEPQEFVEQTVARVTAIREEIGKGMDLSLDFRSRPSPAMARRLLLAIEPLYPMFVEEPCLPESIDALAGLAASTAVPLAAGGHWCTRWGVREALEKRAVAVLQPGVGHTGGLLETRKIAAMAEAYGVLTAPHNQLGPIALAASLQVDACTPNFLIQEHPGMSNRWDLGLGYLATPFTVREGFIDVPKGPGLGIEVNEEALRERADEGADDTPHPLNPEDHSFAE